MTMSGDRPMPAAIVASEMPSSSRRPRRSAKAVRRDIAKEAAPLRAGRSIDCAFANRSPPSPLSLHGTAKGPPTEAMKLFLLDRDGVVVVNRRDNIKSAEQLVLVPGAAEAIARLNSAGWRVALCTNQPEVGRGAMTKQQLDAVHEELEARLAETGARLDLILCCTSIRKCPTRKPAAGMLR